MPLRTMFSNTLQLDTKLIIGLGNPGAKYDKTRHNIGFMVLDALAEQADVSFSDKSKLHAQEAKFELDEHTIRLIKPQTFMNESGRSLAAVLAFYRVSVFDCLVISDDIDLDFGVLRSRLGGGHGGHNGLRSLIQHSGEDFARLRLGVGNDTREHIDASDFVLQQFSKAEQADLPKIITAAQTMALEFARGDFSEHSQTVL